MKIELKEITIRDLTRGYQDNGDDGVFGYGGKLNIRLPYQREFVYSDNQRDAVIKSVINKFPLDVMYWSLRNDGDFEILDGQQRTVSICQYVNDDFSFDGLGFVNLQDDEKSNILDYKLMIYVCSGTPSEKLKWFEIINIAGEKLTNQELLNAIFAGPWVTDAKRYFSKVNGPAYGLGSKYLKGAVNRQAYLETAIKWKSKDKIKDFMGLHQHKPDATDLWLYFESVINWVQVKFPEYRSQMKGLNRGKLYDEFKDEELDPAKLEKQVKALMMMSRIKKVFIHTSFQVTKNN